MRAWKAQRTAWGSVILGVAALAALLGLLGRQELEVVADRAPQPLVRAAGSAGTRFAVSFRHSVEGIRVSGEFVVEAGGALRAVRTSYPSYGAGLEPLPHGPATEITRRMMRWSPEGRRFPELIFRVTRAEDFRLRVGARELPLSTLLPDSTRVRIRSRRVSLLRLLSRRLLAAGRALSFPGGA